MKIEDIVETLVNGNMKSSELLELKPSIFRSYDCLKAFSKTSMIDHEILKCLVNIIILIERQSIKCLRFESVDNLAERFDNLDEWLNHLKNIHASCRLAVKCA